MTAKPPTTLPEAPPEGWEPLIRIARLAARPLERFLGIQAASGITLLVAAAVALLAANSRFAEVYQHFWHTPLTVGIGKLSFVRPLEWWVNDGLMAIFFFVVGLEIRREIHHGELSDFRRAALPLFAALGGMLAPALLYLAFARSPETSRGWGVPMATDIAFAVGILALLGRRVPAALRVLLLALAVIDDLGAIVVIAVAYSSGIQSAGLLLALGGVLAIVTLQSLGVRARIAYGLPALVVWAGAVQSGIHPTIAGVVIGLLTPVRAWLGSDGFVRGIERELEGLRAGTQAGLGEALKHVDEARREAISPAESLIDALHPWVAYGIMPLFALANAGVRLHGPFDGSAGIVATATTVGLALGKPLGVVGAIAIARSLRIATLPRGLGWRHVVVLGLVAGIGFTMALFVAPLAFAAASPLTGAKVGVLAGSGISAVLALGVGRLWLSVPREEAVAPVVAESADAAECSPPEPVAPTHDP